MSDTTEQIEHLERMIDAVCEDRDALLSELRRVYPVGGTYGQSEVGFCKICGRKGRYTGVAYAPMTAADHAPDCLAWGGVEQKP